MQHSCPICKTAVDIKIKTPWIPFCSERCQCLDLDHWFSGQYAIAGENVSPHQDAHNGEALYPFDKITDSES